MYVHVAVVKNISNVVVNNTRESRKYRGLQVFSRIQLFCIQMPIFNFRYLLDTFFSVVF